MELKKQIYDEIVKRLDLDEETLKDFSYDTVMFDIGDGTENLGLDSIDALELVTIIYDKWGIDVPTGDMKKLYSVDAIAEYIENFEQNQK